ncbi:MAG: DUF2889 domain-containing protein [Alphaproteobacteria bacterium]|nr:DUF2889 domain-containing protein [Alphaproteobacteria bacterium]MDP6812518.1 DUF2889 domain-containing protein [Alphaproteobacteria bacterium]
MPFSDAASRDLMHTRNLDLRAYRRHDGLWDIEGHITDIKPFDYSMLDSERTAAEPVHDMWLRLTVDDDFVVRGAKALIDVGAHGPCHEIAHNYAELEGLRVGPGWNRGIRERLGGVRGCTHLNDMLGQMATTAMQALWEVVEEQQDQGDGHRQLGPGLLNSCHAYGATSPYVKDYFPDYYEGD